MKKEEIIKGGSEKNKCNHKFVFSHWEGFVGEGYIIHQKAVVICEKCGEIRIKDAN